MSQWTHAICKACWAKARPGRKPTLTLGPHPEKCCFCGVTAVGCVLIRADPSDSECHGEGGFHVQMAEREERASRVTEKGLEP